MASLAETIQEFAKTFAQDLELVRAKAQSHGVGLSSGTLKTRLAHHSYNLRLPGTSDAKTLQTSPNVVIDCMDHRQVNGAKKKFRTRAFITNAGGGVQPEPTRRAVTGKLVGAVHQENPTAKVTIVGHQRICGGGEHFSGGQFSKANAQGLHVEEQLVTDHLRLTAQEAVKHGADPKRIRLAIAEIGPNNIFTRIRKIKWP